MIQMLSIASLSVVHISDALQQFAIDYMFLPCCRFYFIAFCTGLLPLLPNTGVVNVTNNRWLLQHSTDKENVRNKSLTF
jgi:hypothetical protein